MKHKGFYVGLVLSLSLNAGAMFLYGLDKYEVRRLRQENAERFKPGASQLQVNRLQDDLHKALAPAADTMRTAIKELGLLALEPEPDSARVNAALDRIAWAQRENSRLWREFSRAVLRLIRPDRVELMRNETKSWRDHELGAESSRVSEPREPR
ncbi:MAG TPA: hypothetical protein VMH22_12690 [bacterium]|nr:hypothetical protein [bacterium]